MLKLGKPSARKSQRIVIKNQVEQTKSSNKQKKIQKEVVSSKPKRKTVPIQKTTITTIKKQKIQQTTPKKRKISITTPKTHKQTKQVPIPYYTVHPMEELWLSLPGKK